MTDDETTEVAADAAFRSARAELRGLAHRLLGSAADAEDVLQEAWLRFRRVDVAGIDNVTAWLRTVVTHLCLDELRARQRRPALLEATTDLAEAGSSIGPEETALVADSVTRAMLVVLDRLDPDERVAFVLHDVFAVPFADIGPIVDRSAATAKKLASRARGKVRGNVTAGPQLRHRAVVERFLAAAGSGDLGGLVAVLAPDVVRRSDLRRCRLVRPPCFGVLTPWLRAPLRWADAPRSQRWCWSMVRSARWWHLPGGCGSRSGSKSSTTRSRVTTSSPTPLDSPPSISA
jgi:RNA polymerase sigma-70 factor, ECF subfamily